ncbi:MAG: hypothetical protein ACT4P3_20650 [Betaproteobacteria bacterium]
MPGHDIIAIGASAGGLKALREIVAALPAGLELGRSSRAISTTAPPGCRRSHARRRPARPAIPSAVSFEIETDIAEQQMDTQRSVAEAERREPQNA